MELKLLFIYIKYYLFTTATVDRGLFLLSVYHSELLVENSSPDAVRLQVSRLEHLSGVRDRSFLLHVDPHLHGLQAGVDPRIAQTGQTDRHVTFSHLADALIQSDLQ